MLSFGGAVVREIVSNLFRNIGPFEAVHDSLEMSPFRRDFAAFVSLSSRTSRIVRRARIARSADRAGLRADGPRRVRARSSAG